MKLSILIPIYNEVRTLEAIVSLIASALPNVDKELVLVDDGSKDGTRPLLERLFGPATPESALVARGPAAAAERPFAEKCTARLVFHDVNKGKGGAIRTAMSVCTGDTIVIQDADLEYDPGDLDVMFDLIARRKVADVVYGSRFYGKPHRSLNYHHYLANRLISTVFNILFNQTLTDIEVCYKMFSRDVLGTLVVTCNDFGLEVQISAQIALARRWRIYETAIHYYGRTYDEGKKINWKDGVKAVWYLLRFRVSPGN
jgi:glycosyltransferase involved in cell wall biosynthesis